MTLALVVFIVIVLVVTYIIFFKKNNIKKSLVHEILIDIQNSNDIIVTAEKKWFYQKWITERELIIFKLWLYKNIFVTFANKNISNKKDILYSFDKIYTVILDDNKLLTSNFTLKHIEERLKFYDTKLNNMDYVDIWYLWKYWEIDEEELFSDWLVDITMIINNLRLFQVNFLEYLVKNYSNIKI